MALKKVGLIIAVSLASALSAVFIYRFFEEPGKVIIERGDPVHFASLTPAPSSGSQPIDFTYAASVTTPAVVHIKTTYKAPERQYTNPFYYYFNIPDQEPQERASFGSGVILSSDGFIVTNNHVVADGESVSVTLHNNKTFTGKVIGTDPSTDLALIKVDETGLDYVEFANSDDVMIGEWVLAAGNPFNFSSTVTAGIVSAKGRSIDILDRSTMPVESFIQTDAAVNRGNSGGALVNTEGKLIGINTAIVSPSGTYAGYSFAVPSNIVKKVVDDLKGFGVVQRGMLGVAIRSMNSLLAEEMKTDVTEGVYVDEVTPGSAAEIAGIEKGDIITHINERVIRDVPSLQEQVARHSPGDEITITYLRSGKPRSAKAVLRNKNNTTEVVKVDDFTLQELLGADFENLSESELKKNGIASGVKVARLREGPLSKEGIREGFIITRINNRAVGSVDEMKTMLKPGKGGVMMEGLYSGRPGIYYYAFGLEK